MSARRVNPLNDIAIEVTAELVLYAPRFHGDSVANAERCIPVGSIKQHFTGTPHRHETTDPALTGGFYINASPGGGSSHA
jgi:hypothetical protein